MYFFTQKLNILEYSSVSSILKHFLYKLSRFLFSKINCIWKHIITTDMDHVMSGLGLCYLWVQGSAAAAYTDRAEQPGQCTAPSAVSALPGCKHPRVTDTRAFKLHQMLPSDLWNTVYKEGLLAIQPSWQWSHPGNGCQCEGDPGFV